MTWTKKALLRLIHIKKRTAVTQKLVKADDDGIQPILIYGQKRKAKVVTQRHSFVKCRRSGLEVDDQ